MTHFLLLVQVMAALLLTACGAPPRLFEPACALEAISPSVRLPLFLAQEAEGEEYGDEEEKPSFTVHLGFWSFFALYLLANGAVLFLLHRSYRRRMKDAAPADAPER